MFLLERCHDFPPYSDYTLDEACQKTFALLESVERMRAFLTTACIPDRLIHAHSTKGYN